MSSAVIRGSTHEPETSRDAVETPVEYPGIPTTCDGAEAVVHVEINISQAAGAYPITSSTTMGGGFNAAVMNGLTNLWGDSLVFFDRWLPGVLRRVRQITDRCTGIDGCNSIRLG